MLNFSWEVPIEPVSKCGTDDEFKSAETAAKSHIAWTCPKTDILKMPMHSCYKYSRAIPEWELQSPSNGFTLASLLQVLEEVDEACVLTVRKIHKIGLNSAQILREYFSRYGEVDRVMLLPSRPKSTGTSPVSPSDIATPSYNKQPYVTRTEKLLTCNFVTGKVRPASMAFVVMRSRQPAILARLNEVHMIEGCAIQVQKFHRDPSGHQYDSSVIMDVSPTVSTISKADLENHNINNPEKELLNWLNELSSVVSTYRSSAKFIN